ncbi:hypothetical protein WA538_004050, partial [Blastocystis sp. DL]
DHPARQRSHSLFVCPPSDVHHVDKAKELYFLRLGELSNQDMKSSNVYDSDYSDSLSPSDSLDPKRSKSIKIVKRPRGRAFSSSYRGITEDMAISANVMGTYDFVGNPEALESPSPRNKFVPPHLAHYSSESADSFSSQ